MGTLKVNGKPYRSPLSMRNAVKDTEERRGLGGCRMPLAGGLGSGWTEAGGEEPHSSPD